MLGVAFARQDGVSLSTFCSWLHRRRGMLDARSTTRIFLAAGATDVRKSFDTLSAIERGMVACWHRRRRCLLAGRTSQADGLPDSRLERGERVGRGDLAVVVHVADAQGTRLETNRCA